MIDLERDGDVFVLTMRDGENRWNTTFVRAFAEALDEVETKWQGILENVTEIAVTPYKKDILMELYGVGWLPYYSYQDGGKQVELAAFSSK